MLQDLKPLSSIRSCKVRAILDNLDDDDQDILMEALLNRDTWNDNALAKALTSKGLGVSPNTVAKHRNRVCTCRLLDA
jgi:hypothetical protein